MQYLNTFLGLLAKTQSRDKILRLVQYATLHSQDHSVKGSTYNVYVQMRRVRKIIRLLRTLECSARIRKEASQIPSNFGDSKALLLKILIILENLFTFLFYYFDHRVLLGDLQIISKQTGMAFYPKSMKMYIFQNIFTILRALVQMVIILFEGKYNGEMLDMDSGSKLLKGKGVQVVRSLLDIWVGVYYLNKPKGQAGKVGVIGVITSIIGICQSLKLI